MGNDQDVTIDLTRDGALTLASVRCLLASASDKTRTQLRVTKAGIAFISSEPIGKIDGDDFGFCLESWTVGTGYVGEQAAQDEEWVGRIYKVLKDNWPNPSSPYIDLF